MRKRIAFLMSICIVLIALTACQPKEENKTSGGIRESYSVNSLEQFYDDLEQAYTGKVDSYLKSELIELSQNSDQVPIMIPSLKNNDWKLAHVNIIQPKHYRFYYLPSTEILNEGEWKDLDDYLVVEYWTFMTDQYNSNKSELSESGYVYVSENREWILADNDKTIYIYLPKNTEEILFETGEEIYATFSFEKYTVDETGVHLITTAE